MPVLRDSPDPQSPLRALLLSLDGDAALRLQARLDSTPGPQVHIEHAEQDDTKRSELRRDHYDLVFIDLTGRPPDRLQLVVRVRELVSDLPILVLTDSYDPREAQRALRLGAQDVLPCSQARASGLRRAFRHSLERHAVVAELLEARHQAQFVATHDPLTQLPNRILLREQLARALSQAARAKRQLAVLFIDLDRFKAINDTLGHAVGDDLLAQVAERLASSIRRADTVSRIGGDEFVVMVEGFQGDQAPANVAEKVLKNLSAPFALNGRDYWISCSIGIAVFPRDGAEPNDLLRNADVALYQAKAQGRNAFRFYNESMNREVRQRLEIETRLRRALQRGDELRLVYQPVVEATTGRITGAEALMRWRDPDFGDISPEEFIPIAEEGGLIVTLGEWTLRTACRQLSEWRAQGIGQDLTMMINLSAVQLERDGLRSTVSAALWDYNLKSKDVSLEVTESALMRNESRAIETLSELKRMGFGIALDDFGTGFSSLNYLKKFPVDTVKIDRAFVRDLAFDSDDAAIVAAVLSIARQLELNVVAEGVETIEQRDFLREHFCPEIQGFLYSHPVPPEELAAILTAGTCEPKPVDGS
jgi:diguanylate cyclase (GGDEF)-like protein